jgi:hypothetical protein
MDVPPFMAPFAAKQAFLQCGMRFDAALYDAKCGANRDVGRNACRVNRPVARQVAWSAR